MGEDRDTKYSGGVPVVPKTSDDPVIALAKIEAQSHLDDFINKLTEHFRSDTYTFSVKAPFTENSETEHMWVIVTSYNDGLFYGILGNEPLDLKNIKEGDPITVARSDVEDFLVSNSNNSELIGGFSLIAFGKKLP
jgi:uncharacterized protein YegJ (DUF2314 family)